MTARRDSSNASRPAPAPAWPMPRGGGAALRFPCVSRCHPQWRDGGAVVVPIAAQRATTRRRDVAGAGRPLGGSRHAVLPRLAQQSMDRLLFSRVRNGLGHRARWRQPAARESALRGRATGGTSRNRTSGAGCRPLRAGTLWPGRAIRWRILRHGPGAASGRLGAARVPPYRAVQAGASLEFHCAGAPGANGAPETARPGNPYARTIMASSTAQTYFVRPSPSGWARRACHLVPPVLAGPAGCCRACGGRPGGQAMRDVCLPLAAQRGQP